MVQTLFYKLHRLVVLHIRLNYAATFRSTQKDGNTRYLLDASTAEREEDIQQQLMVYLIDLENHVKHPFPKLLWVSY